MTRERLPARRPAISFDVEHEGQRYAVTVGHFGERAAEVFINSRKTSSSIEALARDAAILISIALQHGVPAEEMCAAVTRGDRGEAATIVGTVLDAMATAPD